MANLPWDMPFGIGMLAPVLMAYGSKEQQDRFLPDIRARKVNWCQGYSEPGAGSDLASLKTKAVLSDDGTHYTVNGTKIWTTAAHIADWIFCLTRTDDSGKKQEGITFLLFPMKQEGVEVFIRTILVFTGKAVAFGGALLGFLMWSQLARLIAVEMGVWFGFAVNPQPVFFTGIWLGVVVSALAILALLVRSYRRFDPTCDAAR